MIVNHAIHNPDSPVRMEYPFSQHSLDGKYKIPTGANIKKALSFDDIERLKTYRSETESEQRALDFWLFSYYYNGINMSDLCKLRFRNIVGDQIVFTRSKTARARKNPKIIQAYLHPEMRKIIEKWGTPNRLQDNYIFPILEYNSNPEREHQIVKQFTRWVNEYLHRISKNLGFEKNISTYHARHSFATVMKRKNVNIAFISDSLGHSSLKTTENYLAGFTDETIKDNSSLL